MIYLLKSPTGYYRLYCSTNQQLSGASSPLKQVFKIPFVSCRDFTLKASTGSWGTQDTWYTIEKTFADDDYPEFFI